MPPALPSTTFNGASSENFLESEGFMSPAKIVLSCEVTETQTGLVASIVSSKGIDPSATGGATGSGFFASSPRTLSPDGPAGLLGCVVAGVAALDGREVGSVPVGAVVGVTGEDAAGKFVSLCGCRMGT